MPRRRYPSDEARLKVRPHVKVHHTLRSHPKTAELCAKPEMRGMLLGLWMCASEAFAGYRGDEVTLTHADLTFITGRTHLRHAVNAMHMLCESMQYPIRVHGQCATVTIRNFAKKQGHDSAKRGETTGSTSASDTDTDTDTDIRESSAESAEKKTAQADPVEAVWPDCQQAVAAYGAPRWRKLNADRKSAMRARLREHNGEPAEILVHAIHGCAWKWKRNPPKDGDWRQWLTAETIYRPANFDKYLEAYEQYAEAEQLMGQPQSESLTDEELAALPAGMGLRPEEQEEV